MRRHRHSDHAEPPRPAGDQTDKLAGVRPLAHDDDERPSREDRSYGSTIFNRLPVPLPRFLTGAKKRSRDPNRRLR
ncbi:MAG TPA: hypothetical protein VK631_02855 [Solirubrobacteraceae bacterium]|nr:hypothetical protein [Solirubrobacteraceae bacterium]